MEQTKRLPPSKQPKVYVCEQCNSEYTSTSNSEHNRKKNKIANGRHICYDCVRKESYSRLIKAGTEALKKIDPEERKKMCSYAGKKAASSPNSGRFTTERWNELTYEEQQSIVTRANRALHEKLKDPDYCAEHYTKAHKNRKVGYISSAQMELFNIFGSSGFVLEGVVSKMSVDLVNFDLKIAIEYNGDYWHCNPRTWSADDYNKSIKMTAKEKWRRDFARRKFLENEGYTVVVIWESGFKSDKQKYIDRINKEIEDARNRN